MNEIQSLIEGEKEAQVRIVDRLIVDTLERRCEWMEKEGDYLYGDLRVEITHLRHGSITISFSAQDTEGTWRYTLKHFAYAFEYEFDIESDNDCVLDKLLAKLLQAAKWSVLKWRRGQAEKIDSLLEEHSLFIARLKEEKNGER